MIWIFSLKEDIDAASITHADTTNKEPLVIHFYWNVVRMEKRKKTGSARSDENKRSQSGVGANKLSRRF